MANLETTSAAVEQHDVDEELKFFRDRVLDIPRIIESLRSMKYMEKVRHLATSWDNGGCLGCYNSSPFPHRLYTDFVITVCTKVPSSI